MKGRDRRGRGLGVSRFIKDTDYNELSKWKKRKKKKKFKKKLVHSMVVFAKKFAKKYFQVHKYIHPIPPCPVNWGCRLHQLHLCRGVRPPPSTSVLDIWCWVSSNAGALGNAEHHFITIAPRSSLARSGITW